MFKLSPPAGKRIQWSENVLWSFGATNDDGANPLAGLLADQSGNLYGTTSGGGANGCFAGGCGTVFKLTPPAGKHSQWSEYVLWSFGATSDDGQNPVAGVIADKWGNLYSTTSGGGINGDGTVFELSPPNHRSQQWSEGVLWSFSGEDGIEPLAGLLADQWGNLYGTAINGGESNAGTVFELSPPAGKSKGWSADVLWSFDGTNGNQPLAGVIADKWDNLYGTTEVGGTNRGGTVFELNLP